MINKLGWRNNQWIKIDEIFLSIKDRGLKFSDGIFETILIKNNKAILLGEHLERMKRTSKLLNIRFPSNQIILEDIINEGIKKLSLKNYKYGSIRINLSRGLNIDRSIKIQPENNKFDINNLWIEFYEIEIDFKPINVHISTTEKRNEYSLLSQCKTFSYNQSIQALIEANQKNFDDSLILNTKNELCCGTTFSIIIKRDSQWITPSKTSGCLPGIMINKLLNLKLVKEQESILPKFKKEDILIAINSLSCKQIKRVNDFEFLSDFDPRYYWEILYN